MVTDFSSGHCHGAAAAGGGGGGGGGALGRWPLSQQVQLGVLQRSTPPEQLTCRSCGGLAVAYLSRVFGLPESALIR